jgi:CrcB protein
MSGIVYKWLPTTFPYGNLVVNLSACFAIGFLMIAFEQRFMVTPEWRIFLAVGILGGYSTFSSFTYETMMLVRDGEVFKGMLNAVISVGGGLLATMAGLFLGKFV